MITTHRRLALLQEAIQSVVDQTHGHLDIVVVDDAGEPAVARLVKDFAGARGRLRYVDRAQHLEIGGGQQCRNLGRREALGDFILFLDDDDLLAPNCVAGRLAALEDDSRLDAAVGQCSLFDGVPTPQDPLWRPWTEDQDDLLMFLSNRVPWQTSGPLWRRSALDLVGSWDEALRAGWDYEFHIRALAKGVQVRRLPQVDYHWRVPRPDSYSGLEAFKKQHKAGDHIEAMRKGVRAIEDAGRWTKARRAATWRESLRLAAMCRLNDGPNRIAQGMLLEALQAGCVSPLGYAEAALVTAAWFRVGSRIPALAYLNRRGLI